MRPSTGEESSREKTLLKKTREQLLRIQSIADRFAVSVADIPHFVYLDSFTLNSMQKNISAATAYKKRAPHAYWRRCEEVTAFYSLDIVIELPLPGYEPLVYVQRYDTSVSEEECRTSRINAIRLWKLKRRKAMERIKEEQEAEKQRAQLEARGSRQTTPRAPHKGLSPKEIYERERTIKRWEEEDKENDSALSNDDGGPEKKGNTDWAWFPSRRCVEWNFVSLVSKDDDDEEEDDEKNSDADEDGPGYSMHEIKIF